MPLRYHKEKILPEMEYYGLIKKLNKKSYQVMPEHKEKVRELKDARDDPLGILK